MYTSKHCLCNESIGFLVLWRVTRGHSEGGFLHSLHFPFGKEPTLSVISVDSDRMAALVGPS